MPELTLDCCHDEYFDDLILADYETEEEQFKYLPVRWSICNLVASSFSCLTQNQIWI